MDNSKLVYVTKYATTKGIFKMRAIPVDNWKYAKQVKVGLGHFLARKDFAFTEEEAIAQAEKKRDAKVKGLNKKLIKLLSLNFSATIDNVETLEG